MKFGYQRQETEQTLGAGLAEYRTVFGDKLLREEKMDAESARLFHGHDCCHVLFGCDTSTVGEGLVDTWTLIGSDVGFSTYSKYLNSPTVKAIFRQVGLGPLLWGFLIGLPDVIRAAWRAWHMKKKWPFFSADTYMQRPIREIRAEFGIHVL
jgi:hypothetical protein